MIGARPAGALQAERLIGRLLTGITYASVALLLAGVGLLIAAGISPLAGGPGLDLGQLPSDVLGMRPTGFLWLGLLAVIAAPIARVGVALVAYARVDDWLMVAVSAGILLVIGVAIGSAVAAV
jgi:uncharacterized membrane protein